MPEGFEVDEAHLAGFSELSSEIANQVASLMGHVNHEARPDSGFTGVMALLKPPVDTYAHETTVRLANRIDRLNGMAKELNRAAWVYSGADESAYQTFDHLTPGVVTGYKDFPSPIPYSAGDEPKSKRRRMRKLTSVAYSTK